MLWWRGGCEICGLSGLWSRRTTPESGVAGSRTIIRVNSISIMQIEFGLRSGGGTEVDVSIGRFPPAVL